MTIDRVTSAIERRRSPGRSLIRVLHGPEQGLEVIVPPQGIVVGAEHGLDIVLTDSAVSRRHASVVPREDGFEVLDLGSRNGTWLDDLAITRAVVPLGATVRVGTTLLHLLPSEDPIEIPPSESGRFGAMVGSSLTMRRAFGILERASQSDASVLLLGESGTGKELAARAIHEHSGRASGPFVVFDCGTASETLIESDLFGHVRGAFTGADAERAGAFERAHGGTLFLDEIGDLPLPHQPKLLRALERGEVMRLGARTMNRFDVRIVAATHHDLFAEVGCGAFRGDLYYRLAVVEVTLPPLRKRREDITSLVQTFLAAAGRPTGDVTGPALHRLESYAWPGNVRELRNVVARALALAPPKAAFDKMPFLLRPHVEEKEDRAENLRVRTEAPFHDAKAELVEQFERIYVEELLRRHPDNMSEAARVAGIERKHLYTLVGRLGLQRGK